MNRGSIKKLVNIVQPVYDTFIRDRLPRRIGLFNQIPSRSVGFFDFSDVIPLYEDAIISSVRNYINEGDEVVEIGGGRGVTAAAAAKEVGPSGNIRVFEGSIRYVNRIMETAELNNINNIQVEHAIVGEAISLLGKRGDPNTVEPEKLPECDVLMMDCEGAEVEILNNLSISPRLIIVETHDMLNAPMSDVKNILEEKGYNIIEQRKESDRSERPVLTAQNN